MVGAAIALHRLLETEMELQTQPPDSQPASSICCCPPFDPRPWGDGRVTWQDKLFVRDRLRCFFHVPLNMGARMSSNQRLIEAAHAAPAQPLILTDERSPWAADLYLEVTHPVPGCQMAELSGTFLTKVYEGPYRDAGKWAADMRRHVQAQQQELVKLYFGFTTCPRCAKAYGKNYVVLFAQVRDAARLPRASTS
jgi:hypothetical protein